MEDLSAQLYDAIKRNDVEGAKQILADERAKEELTEETLMFIPPNQYHSIISLCLSKKMIDLFKQMYEDYHLQADKMYPSNTFLYKLAVVYNANDILYYLLTKNKDENNKINFSSQCMDAIMTLGTVDCLRVAFESGVDFNLIEHELNCHVSPLKLTAFFNRIDMCNMIIKNKWHYRWNNNDPAACDREEKDAFKLIACNFIKKMRDRQDDRQKAVRLLSAGLRPLDQVEDSVEIPSVLEGVTECVDQSELERRDNNWLYFKMQAVLINFRLFGAYCVLFQEALYGYVMSIPEYETETAFRMLMYLLVLEMDSKTCSNWDVSPRTFDAFIYLRKLFTSDNRNILDDTLYLLRVTITHVQNHLNKNLRGSGFRKLQGHLIMCYHVLTQYTSMLTYSQRQYLEHFTHDVIQLAFPDQKSFLHVLCSNDAHINSLLSAYKLRRSDINIINIINWMVVCGAQVNLFDNEFNTPFHLAITNRLDDKVIDLMLSHGAHPDYHNIHGECVFDYLDVQRKFLYRTLTCITANSIRQHNLDYTCLPDSLIAFVDRH